MHNPPPKLIIYALLKEKKANYICSIRIVIITYETSSVNLKRGDMSYGPLFNPRFLSHDIVAHSEKADKDEIK